LESCGIGELASSSARSRVMDRLSMCSPIRINRPPYTGRRFYPSERNPERRPRKLYRAKSVSSIGGMPCETLACRASAQLELLAASKCPAHAFKGKGTGVGRGLPSEPAAVDSESGGARCLLRYFIIILPGAAIGVESAHRPRTSEKAKARDDTARLAPVTACDSPPRRVARFRERWCSSTRESCSCDSINRRRCAARDAMNPAPQTILPDMPLALATTLLKAECVI